MLLNSLSKTKTEETFAWQRKEGASPLVMGYSERILTLADMEMGNRIIVQQRSRRIETRTKGKRRMKRLVKEFLQRMGEQTLKTAFEMFHYRATGKYP